jgi:hypothetical protein
MKALPLISPLAAILGVGKKPKAPAPTIQARTDSAAEAAANRDLISQRRGAGANQLTGRLGAESRAGAKTQLGA